MKKKLYIGVMLAAVLTSLSSCKDENWNHGPSGSDNGELNMTDLSIDVSEIEKVIKVDSRGVDASSYDINSFVVKITNKETEATVNQWTYATTPEIVSLAPGAYTVTVFSHDVQPAEWEKPYFHVEKDVTIHANAVERLGVMTAKLANSAVSIIIDEELKKYCSDDVQVEVVANNEGRLVYGIEESRKGYFKVIDGSTTLVVTFTGTVNGYKEHIELPQTDLQAGQHRIYTFRAKTNTNPVPDETGNVDPGSGIGIDVNVSDEDVDGDVTLEEDYEIVDPSERPDYEDPDDPGKDPDDPGKDPDDPDNPDNPDEQAATFTAPAGISDLDLNGINNFKEFGDGETFPGTKKAVLLIECPGKISKLVVKISSNYLTKDFMQSIQLDDEFDMANPGSYEEGLKDLELLEDGKPIKGQTQATFDITKLAPMLSIGAEPNDNHSFTITVTNEAGKSASQVLVFSDHN